MNRCKTCINWVARYGDCNCERFVYNEEVPSDGLAYWDAERYSADFRTGPDFGCVHWEGGDE